MRGGTHDVEAMSTRELISIHPPHAGRDCHTCHSRKTMAEFQSTLPMRGGTRGLECWRTHYRNFNPPSPCGEGHYSADKGSLYNHISIHPPHAGRDITALTKAVCTITFQSTLPMRGGTSPDATAACISVISIHPPHAGRDKSCKEGDMLSAISIHPPHAGRDRA